MMIDQILDRRTVAIPGPQGKTGDKGDKGEQGLPGVNAIPTIDAVSLYSIPRWRAGRAYASGDVVSTPAGNIARRTTTGTSTAQWNTTEAVLWLGIRGEVFAEDFGVIGNGATDDTAPMVAALAAARDLKADLVLPNRRIKLSGALTWCHRLHNITGGSMTILDWGAASFTGAALTLDSSQWVGDIAQIRTGVCRSVLFAGPLSSFTNTIGVTHLDAHDTVGVHFENCGWHGFKDQFVFGNNAYLWQFTNCRFRYALRYTARFGGLNMGENFSFEHCVFFNNNNEAFILTESTNAGDLKFSKCSFDGGKRVADVNGGTLNFDNCHFEGNNYGPQWFKLASGGSAPTVVRLTGGQLYVSTRSDGVRHTLFRIVEPSASSSNQVAIDVDGTQIIDRSGSAGAVLVVDESGLVTPWGSNGNIIRMHPVLSTVTPSQEISLGASSVWRGSEIRQMPTLITSTAPAHGDSWRSSYSATSAPLSATFDPEKVRRDGTKGALLFQSTTTSGTGTFLGRRFSCTSRPLVVSVSLAWENLLIDVGGSDLRVSWWADSAATVPISTSNIARTLIPRHTTPQTIGWRTHMVVLNPPPGAILGEVWFGNAWMSGKIWVQDFDLMPL